MTTDKCFSCERKDGSSLCEICGVGLNGEREYYKRKPQTNADRIRSLSDEELAEFLDSIVQDWHQGTAQIGDRIIDSWLDWLKEEVKGDNDDQQNQDEKT